MNPECVYCGSPETECIEVYDDGLIDVEVFECFLCGMIFEEDYE